MSQEMEAMNSAPDFQTRVRRAVRKVNLWAAGIMLMQAVTIGLLVQQGDEAESASYDYDMMPDISTAEDLARDARDSADEATSAAREAAEEARASGRQAAEAATAIRNLSLLGVRCDL